ncbi:MULTISPECIES: GtrA family protein [Corynebacterium]|uniref:Membrane protein n=1 Tax=Corynebacterium flavescens TaxID=28028 RepID=A0A1L7CJC9_CORFL|nr:MULTISPECIES: GtrA family protein [Corynebacterium]APT85908.1 membrane protein [Corynebacterium flavescens]MDN6099827.1 GtrA family protein [Corynebacterium flavescens]MDN6198444.1 GtrA family protein [Corynebacterium flavescens]MDN6226348.1 GtrA family protein [Corynebacterium flavescens]MDN6235704.1 GtrA family protein [Corynebacterium flavescens]
MQEATGLARVAGRLGRSHSLQAHGLKFALIGALCALIDGGLTWTLQLGLEVLDKTQARAVGFVAGTCTAYWLNRRWTFNARGSTRRFLAVAATYALTFGINMLLYDVVFDHLTHQRWDPNLGLALAFAVAQLTATLVNFFIQRWVIFRSTRKSFEVTD